MNDEHVMVLGLGSILFCDEGFGVRVVETLSKRYEFPENVSLVDGGVLGLSLLGVISEADKLIAVDAIRNGGSPGDLYRLDGNAIPERVRAKNSIHQVDFLESLTLCQALDKVPETVIIGVEPADIDTMTLQMTDVVMDRVEPVIDMVLAELTRLGITFRKKDGDVHVSCDTFPRCLD